MRVSKYIFTIIILLATTVRAEGLSCAPVPLEQRMSQSAYVLTGTVVGFAHLHDIESFNLLVTLEIKKVFKDLRAKPAEEYISFRVDPEMGIGYVGGKDYLVFISLRDNYFFDGLCSGSQPVENEAEALEILKFER